MQNSSFQMSLSSFHIWLPKSLKRLLQAFKGIIYILITFTTHVRFYLNLFHFEVCYNIPYLGTFALEWH